MSRVVRLADLMAPPPAAAAPAAKLRAPTAAMPVVGRGTGAVTAMPGAAAGGLAGASLGGASLGGAGLAPGLGAAPGQEFSEPIPVMPVEPRPRRTGLYVGIGLGAAALIVVAALALSSNNEENTGNSTSGGSNDFSGLGYRPTDPRPGPGGQVPDPGPGTAKVPGPGTGRRPSGGTGTPGPGTSTTPGPGTGAGTGKVETGSGNPALGELTPDDVINMSRRMETGTRRCYERAMKADPFLKVSKIRATINVNPGGGVGDVRLSEKADHPLGVCLIAAIKRWPFGPSKEGIVSEVSLVFEQK
ncbi:MAG: hypothetical protein R3B06_28910 [Kofleriaceae bacterium]